MALLRRLVLIACLLFPAIAYAAVGDLVATLSVSGGQGSVTFVITSNPGGYFAIQNGNQIVEAINTPPGNYAIGIQASAPGSSIMQQFTLNYSPVISGNFRIVSTGAFRVTNTGASRIISP